MKKTMKKKSVLEVAYMFVSKDKQRANLCEPWVLDGRINATNGHLLFNAPHAGQTERAILRDGRLVEARGILPRVDFSKALTASAHPFDANAVLGLMTSKIVKPASFVVNVLTGKVTAFRKVATFDVVPCVDFSYLALGVEALDHIGVDHSVVHWDGEKLAMGDAEHGYVVIMSMRGAQ